MDTYYLHLSPGFLLWVGVCLPALIYCAVCLRPPSRVLKYRAEGCAVGKGEVRSMDEGGG